MIQDHDRSGWFGASDTAMIMGNWKTATFAKWWLVKLGLRQDHFTSLAMQTGTVLEHRILDSLYIPKRDRQIKLRPLRLRVNLDGETAKGNVEDVCDTQLPKGGQFFCAERGLIVEVKTYSAAAFRVSKPYWMQAQVEMYAAKKACQIAAYRVTQDDYRNWFLPIDPERISLHPIEYDPEWIEIKYLPRLRYLARRLKERRWPDEAAF